MEGGGPSGEPRCPRQWRPINLGLTNSPGAKFSPGALLLVAWVLVGSGCEDPRAERQLRAENAAQQQEANAPQHPGAAAYSEASIGELALAGSREAAVADAPGLGLGLREAPTHPPLFFFLGSEVRDPVEQVLDEAEAAFRRGEAHYQAGHLEHARQEFDRAVDLLLASPFALREDPRLRFGFDRLVDRIHELELAALRDTAPAEELPEVPAAIDEIAPLTFPIDPTLRAQVEQELSALVHDLPLTLNERVLSVVSFFHTAKGRRILLNGLRRAGRYRELITAVLEEEGLPRDLIYLAQAESAFQPRARSRMRAVGLWQFITQRAREYGLEVNWWVDERRDPVKSTRAAARHLRDLYQRFGDWYLAMAAYNSGPLRVGRALERAGQADYWELVERRLLPRETSNYVAIILAVALMAKDPARYGVEVEPDPPLRFETVKVDKPTDLRRIAEVIGVDVGTLRELNPHLLRNVTPRQQDFVLYVPPGTGEMLAAELPRLPEAARVLWQRHRVRRGETLARIAARYRTSAYTIAQANGISLRSMIHPGDTLLIPSGGGGGTDKRRGRRRGGAEMAYTVQSGDTLSAIAARYGTSAQALARANGISVTSAIRPGDRLLIPEGGTGSLRPHPGNAERLHRVRSGETLWRLSRRYRVPVAALREANPFLAERELRPGDHLTIPD